MAFNFSVVRGLGCCRFNANVKFAKDGRVSTYLEHYPFVEADARRIHGDIVAEMISALRGIPHVSDVILAEAYVVVYMDSPVRFWNERIDRTVHDAAYLLYLKQNVTEPKFIVDFHHEAMRAYDTDVEVGKTVISMYDKTFGDDVSLHGPIVERMIADLRKIPGFQTLFVHQYGVSVSMKIDRILIFRWEPRIDEIVKAAFKDLAANKQPDPGRHVVMTKYPNQKVRNFSADFELSKARFEEFHRPLRPTSETYLVNVGPQGAQVIRELFEIPGVTKVTVSQTYDLSVEIGTAFSWDPIIDKIKHAFVNAFGPISFTE